MGPAGLGSEGGVDEVVHLVDRVQVEERVQPGVQALRREGAVLKQLRVAVPETR